MRRNQMVGRSNDQLKDLDRELDLLRKKRQLLAQEQEFYHTVSYNAHPISPWENPPQLNDYGNQQSYVSPNYVDLYDSARPEGGRRPRKRPAKRWQEEPPKRFRPQESRLDDHPPKRYPSGPPKKFGPPPPKKINSQPPKKFGSQPPRNSAAEPKAPPKPQGPKKPKGPAAGSARAGSASGSKPQNQAASTGSVHVQYSKSNVTEPYIFTNKRQAPKRILGRLEFALGVIFKQMRSRFADHQYRSLFDYDTNIAGVKNLKKALREQIYQAQHDKEVRDIVNIIENYRAMYPETTDESLLQSIADAEQELRTIEEKLLNENPDGAYIKAPIEADTPEEFFSVNMKTLLRHAMDEMFVKVQKLYEDEDKANQPTEPEESIVEDSKEEESKEEESKEEESKEDKEAPSEKYDPEVPTESAVDKTESYKALMDGLIRKQLPKLLPEFKEALINTLNLDQEYVKAKNYIYGHTSVRFRRAVASKKQLKWWQLYFVLIQGKPTLPKKARLQTFIRHFNPTIIKKHKTIPNILYIGFMEKKDFDEILKENETHLDGSQLLIKETKKFQKSEMTPSENAEIKTELDESWNAKLEKEIEDNIEELLTSIRNEQDVQNDKVIVESTSDDDVQMIDNTNPVIELDTTLQLQAKNDGDEPNNDVINEGDELNNDVINEDVEPNNEDQNEGDEQNNEELNEGDEPRNDDEVNKDNEPTNGNEANDNPICDNPNTGNESQTEEAGKLDQKSVQPKEVCATKVGSANSPSVVTRRSSRLHN